MYKRFTNRPGARSEITTQCTTRPPGVADDVDVEPPGRPVLMFKALILLTRRDDTSHDAFADWLLVEHAPMAARLPGLRRLVYNVVDVGPAGGAVDSVAELWFDTQADFEAAYATKIGLAVAADSMAHVTSRVRLFVTEHEVDLPPGA
jgi:uncharacterized protein (TIGR02118 family)